MTQIALFGTSADPPNVGHQAILQFLSQSYDQVVVWAADNPLKSDQTPLAHRMAMLQMLIDAIPSNPANVGLYPDLSSPYTIETLARSQQRWPEADFTLVVGADLLPQLHRWRQAEKLLSQVKLLVIPRTGYVIEGKDLLNLQALGTEVTIADVCGPPVSSSLYRETRDTTVIPAPVQTYIHHQQLYQNRYIHAGTPAQIRPSYSLFSTGRL